MPRAECPECDGTGFVVDESTGVSRATRCRCECVEPSETDLGACGIPRRYLECTFENYHPFDDGQVKPLAIARTYAQNYPDVARGLMFTGPCGTGKTHLAVAILRQLVLEKGATGVFVDYETLLKRIQATWARRGDGMSEDAVLEPVLTAEVLVLDDLGSRRSTPWAEETVGHVLSTRYNDALTTLLTTNLLDEQAPELLRDEDRFTSEFLEHRISERVLSRIHEMCRVVEIAGPDFRRLTKRTGPTR